MPRNTHVRVLPNSAIRWRSKNGVHLESGGRRHNGRLSSFSFPSTGGVAVSSYALSPNIHRLTSPQARWVGEMTFLVKFPMLFYTTLRENASAVLSSVLAQQPPSAEREWMGVEPTMASSSLPINGFEDRGDHQASTTPIYS